MTEEEAKCIVVSVWEAKSCLENAHTMSLEFSTNYKGDDMVDIEVRNGYDTIFAHSWQTGDTLESFLDGFNARFTSIFGLND